VVLNAAAALVIVGTAQDLEDGVGLARESIDSGRARQCLGRLVDLSRAEAAETGAHQA
jgi:anthranilate phosphoribosyltransferase